MRDTLRTLLKRSTNLVILVKTARTGMAAYKAEKRQQAWRRQRTKVISSYLESNPIHKLQLGTGRNILDGWLCTDLEPFSDKVIFLDATKPFPIDDKMFDYIFTEHMIEHIPYRDGLFMLHECYRVLKPGGWVRIATPNMQHLINLYNGPKNELQERYVKWVTDKYIREMNGYRECAVINNFFRNFGHQFIYDLATLQNSLETAGFSMIKQCMPGHSDDQNLHDIEGHGKVIGNDFNQMETMVLEAKRVA